MKIKEIDNCIGWNYADKIEALVTSLNFPWYYLEDITYVNDNTSVKVPGFSHLLYDRMNRYEGRDLAFLSPLLFHIAQDEVREFVRMKISMLLKSDRTEPNNKHIDHSFPHTTILYYVSDSDGDTIFYNGDEIIHRVTPKKGKAVIFDGLIYHASSCPQSYSRRYTINMNYRNYTFEGER